MGWKWNLGLGPIVVGIRFVYILTWLSNSKNLQWHALKFNPMKIKKNKNLTIILQIKRLHVSMDAYFDYYFFLRGEFTESVRGVPAVKLNSENLHINNNCQSHSNWQWRTIIKGWVKEPAGLLSYLCDWRYWMNNFKICNIWKRSFGGYCGFNKRKGT